MKLIEKASEFSGRTLAHCKNRVFTYSHLLNHSSLIQSKILDSIPKPGQVSYLMPQSYEYLVSQWGIWRSGGVAVPLCQTHPPPEWEYMINNSESSLVLVHSSFAQTFKQIENFIKAKVIEIPDFDPVSLSVSAADLDISYDNPAQIIYTSGTTSRPKGVITTHQNISSRLGSMHSAWEWSMDDHILEILPLHHVHGVENVLGTALFSGAQVTFHDKFDVSRVIEELLNNDSLTLFMAVPTIYTKLIQSWEALSEDKKAKFSEKCKQFRLMVSGSMALPVETLTKWEKITGHVLLERYGMTETGMVLTNPLHGTRKAGYVGKPFPGVEVKETNGELFVKSPGLFNTYYNKPEETAKAFDSDGWFITGDVVGIDDDGDFKILGRSSVDVIKTGGYKVSALDVEGELLRHPDIQDIAVVGLPHHQYGQVIGAVLVAKKRIELDALQEWCRERIAAYKKPRKIVQLDEMPRNQMGKVNKKELLSYFN